MARAAAVMVNRPQMLRALPKHVLLALISGAIAGPILYYLNKIELEGQWNLLMAIPIGAIYVNAAVLPLAAPGRLWSFAFIGAMLMMLLMIIGAVLSNKFTFGHGYDGIGLRIVTKVNVATFELLLTGGCLGLFYGLLCGTTAALVVGVAIGSACGYLLGLASAELVEYHFSLSRLNEWNEWRYNSPLHFAWQLGGAMALLHLGACLGAAMGAGPAAANPKSKIENPKSEDHSSSSDSRSSRI